jgi:hypothetical protein
VGSRAPSRSQCKPKTCQTPKPRALAKHSVSFTYQLHSFFLGVYNFSRMGFVQLYQVHQTRISLPPGKFLLPGSSSLPFVINQLLLPPVFHNWTTASFPSWRVIVHVKLSLTKELVPSPVCHEEEWFHMLQSNAQTDAFFGKKWPRQSTSMHNFLLLNVASSKAASTVQVLDSVGHCDKIRSSLSFCKGKGTGKISSQGEWEDGV